MSDRWTVSDLAAYQARQSKPLRMEIVDVGPKRLKYGNRKTEVDNVVFDSKREATRYQDLKVMQAAGLISGLTLQPKYALIVNEISVGNYIGDFAYIENGKVVVEDAKGFRNRVYIIKRKLVRALYGIEIREV